MRRWFHVVVFAALLTGASIPLAAQSANRTMPGPASVITRAASSPRSTDSPSARACRAESAVRSVSHAPALASLAEHQAAYVACLKRTGH